MKGIIIIILLLIIAGLYFFPDSTKGLIKVTGKAVVKVTKGIVNEVKDSNEFNEIKQDVKNATISKINNITKKEVLK